MNTKKGYHWKKLTLEEKAFIFANAYRMGVTRTAEKLGRARITIYKTLKNGRRKT